jgi:DNA-binding response OmpR family regulator
MLTQTLTAIFQSTRRGWLMLVVALFLALREFRLLAYLVEHKGHVLTFRQILVDVWGWAYQDHLNYVHISADFIVVWNL